MIFRLLAILVFLQISNVYADSRLIIHLTDYLANDYGGAVSNEGKVLSEVEYAEQVEFGATALKEGQSNPKINQDAELLKKLTELNNAIINKSAPAVVVPLARAIQKDAIKVSGIALSPASWPNYEKAKTLYQANCVSCHGVDGRGDGPDGVDLDPKPANFHDMGRAPIVSPFAAFNTIRLGVPGTGMLAHEFSDEDVWSLAFYVNTFRFGEPAKSRDALSSKISNEELLKAAAEKNDHDLTAFLADKDNQPDFLKKVRLYFFETQTLDFLVKAQTFLTQSAQKLAEGNQKEAEELSLRAYFEGIEPVETKISANDPSLVTKIEEDMASFRKAIKNKDNDLVEVSLQKLLVDIKEAEALISGQTMTPGLAFISGFSIILREGFEAVLVILAILGVGKAAASSMVTIAIHSGWVISLILGVIGWFLSGWLIAISGMSREIMEAGAAFFAVFVLIYVGFWMHRQTEISRWKEFINVKVKNLAQTKNVLGLFILSFVVTFREVIETVLFLRTVYIDADEHSRSYIFVGVAVAFAIVMAVSVWINTYRTKISLKKFFTVSSVLMMGLATILVGKGIHALQEAGIVGMSIFPVKVRIELLGLFPSWETMIAQVVILVVSILIWKNAGKKSKS
jgi:high-affinity iron transporter